MVQSRRRRQEGLAIGQKVQTLPIGNQLAATWFGGREAPDELVPKADIRLVASQSSRSRCYANLARNDLQDAVCEVQKDPRSPFGIASKAVSSNETKQASLQIR